MRTEDGYIIRKCLAGDSAAFGFLVDKYKGSVYAFAYSRLRNFHDAEDVAQEVFINAYQKLRTLRRWDNVLAWLYSITSNLCKMHIRAQSRRPDREFVEDQDMGSLDNSSMSSYREERLFRSLRDALDSLPEIHRQVLTLHYLGGMKIKEVARFLGTSPSTIARRLRRARIQLSKEMLEMVSRTFEERSLHAAFTLRIVEIVNRMRIQPLPRTAGLPWGLSVATGIIIAVLGFSPRMNLPDVIDSPTDSPVISKTEAAEVGEMPVEVLNAPRTLRISSKQESDYSSGVMFPGQQNASFMAPSGEGGKIPEEPSAQFGKGDLYDIAYSPDGKTFATATGFGIKLYDAGNLNEIGLLGDKQYYEIAFSPDGRLVASSGVDCNINLWDINEQKQIGTLRGHTNTLSDIVFNPNGQILASGGWDNTVRLWDVDEQKQIGILKGHTDPIGSIAFSPDGKALASGGVDKIIRLWDIPEQKQMGLLQGHTGRIWSVAFSPDGKILASGGDRTTRLWDIQEQKQVGLLQGHGEWVWSVAFSPDGKILTSTNDETVDFWDVQEQRQVGSLQGYTNWWGIVFSPDGKTIASICDSAGIDAISFWDVQGQRQTGLLDGFTGYVYSLNFSPDGRILASNNKSHIIFWDAKNQKRIGDIMLPEVINVFSRAIALSPDGELLAAGSFDGSIYLIDVQKQKRIGLLKGHTDYISSIAFTPDGKILASAGNQDQTVRLWDVAEQKEIGVLRNGSWTHCLSISPDGEILAVAVGGERLVRLWDIRTQKEIGVLKDDTCAAWSVAFSPDGKTLASCNQCGVIRLWDYEEQEQVGELRGHISGKDLTFSPDGKWLVSVGASNIDTTTRIWDVQEQKQIAVLKGHAGRINCVAFSRGGKWLASGGEDGTILLWEVNLTVPGSVEPTGKLPGAWGKVKKTELLQNFPNPFNPETWIPFSISEPKHVTIRIYTSTGQLVRTLDLGQKASGAYMSREKAAYWDGKNEKGEPVASDVYFYAMEAGKSSTELRKMVMVR